MLLEVALLLELLIALVAGVPHHVDTMYVRQVRLEVALPLERVLAKVAGMQLYSILGLELALGEDLRCLRHERRLRFLYVVGE